MSILWTSCSPLYFHQIIGDSNCLSSENRYFDHQLGFVINLKKSVMTPLQDMEFLGMVINSKEMTISPKSEITMFRFVSEPTSVNFTVDEGVRTS